MVTSIAVCGDSFGIGIGISNDPQKMISESFGARVAKYFEVPIKIFARSGCCNYVIYLQVKKVIEQFKTKEINPLVLITVTHHSRFVFPIENEPHHIIYDLSDVNYKIYNIFHTEEELESFLPFIPKKEPKLISETVSNFLHFNKQGLINLKKFFNKLEKKVKVLEEYFKYLYSDSIKKDYDTSLIVMMHLELKRYNIPHLILTPDDYLSNFIEQQNFLQNDWGYYSKKYPDKYSSGHCTEIGHMELAKIIIEKISQYGCKFSK